MSQRPPTSTEAQTGVCNRCYCACDCCIDRTQGRLVPATPESPSRVTWILRSKDFYGTVVHWTGTGWTGPRRMALRFLRREDALEVRDMQREWGWDARPVRVKTKEVKQ